ncbi:3-deoxy-manno-octulosonate cytidylyltransferase [Pelagicoccus sp. NFK12]|uniref:3-deoxy-manno-octulosonate cytidylyltransferase n=1 Tax=Pelagicoccus enzymogenes TaxID=2773457 RepID=A0A927II11_9BACT|nr:3-deoxy-manno-octulosonate cytidylyltransferase [Pelagicoccus enzymogenes]MBD5780359.1 3-deoxy-manno-octulosonate cytidylyltransferase [Pelagicoccus enzymogenes]
MLAIVAPARLASTRFPEKLLHPICGKPLILWVAERIRDQAPDIPAYFAVDDARLQEVVEGAGFRAIMTRTDHQSGTDRLAEANEQIGADVLINVQADEPLVAASQIAALAKFMEEGATMATLATPFRRRKDFLDPNQVKVVMNEQQDALYFSRAPIPYNRDAFDTFDDAWVDAAPAYRHLGLYAYRAEFLKQFCALPQGKLEVIEKLEQLRALENGVAIKVGLTEEVSIGIDTSEDAAAFAAYLLKED